jgi:hypothetical protein
MLIAAQFGSDLLQVLQVLQVIRWAHAFMLA